MWVMEVREGSLCKDWHIQCHTVSNATHSVNTSNSIFISE